MSSKNRKFRKKDTGESTQEKLAGTEPVSIKSLSGGAREKEKKPKKVSLLSFDEEESLSPVKSKPVIKEKTAPKLRPNLRGLGIKEDAKTVSTQQSGAGEYSAERMRELKANAQLYTGPRASMSTVSSQPEESQGGGFKLSGSFKPASAKNDKPAEDGRNQGNQNGIHKTHQQKPSRAVEQVMPTLQAEGEEETGPQLPSAEMIRLAKLKRERMRSAIVAPDYVPLGGTIDMATLESRLKPEGALQHHSAGDGDESGSDEDHRMTFVAGVRPMQTRGTSAESQVHKLDEDADNSWVQEQIRKGVGAGQTGSAAPVQGATAYAHYPGGGGPILTSKAAADEVSRSGEAAMQALQQSLGRMKITRSNVEKQARKTEENIRDTIEQCAALESRLQAESSKYIYLQQLKGYIADLCDMLQAKAAIVEELEEHLMGAAEQRAAALAQRSAADEAAELDPASASVSAALGVLSHAGSASESPEPIKRRHAMEVIIDSAVGPPQAMSSVPVQMHAIKNSQQVASSAAEEAARHAEERLKGASGPVELDEFGRDISMEGNEEESRRIERRKARDQRWQDDPDGFGGAETTDESDSEERQYKRQRQEVVKTAASVFADADEEYGSLAMVQRRLESWHRSQPEAYRSAYAAESAPAIFAPFVRNELLAWDPIFEDTQDFDGQSWYTSLINFGRASGKDEPSTADGDDDLIPKLIADLVLPLAKHAVQVSWNTFSRKQTRRIVKLIDHLLVYLQVEEPKIQELLNEARSRLEAAIALVKLPPWPAAAVSASPRAAAFLAHRFGKALRLAANIAAFDSLLPRSALISMACERLFQQQLMSHMLGNAGNLEASIKKAERLAAVLPKAWLQGGLPQPLKPLAEHLRKLGRSLESKRKESLPGLKPLARRLDQALDKLGEAEASKKLASAYKL